MKMYQYLDPVVGLIDALVLLVGLYDADGCSDVGSFGATTVGRDGLHLPRTERPQPQRTTSLSVIVGLTGEPVFGNTVAAPISASRRSQKTTTVQEGRLPVPSHKEV